MMAVAWIDFNLLPKFGCTCNSEKINSIISNLALAIISASIFYFIDVYLKEIVQRRKVRPTLISHFDSILSLANGFKRELEITLGEELKFNNSKLLMLQLFKINLDDIYTANRIVEVTWEGFIKEIITDTRTQIDRLMLFSQMMDLDTIILLRRIYDCNFFRISLSIAPVSIQKQWMAKWAIVAKAKYQADNINWDGGTGKLSSMQEHLIEYYSLITELKKLRGT